MMDGLSSFTSLVTSQCCHTPPSTCKEVRHSNTDRRARAQHNDKNKKRGEEESNADKIMLKWALGRVTVGVLKGDRENRKDNEMDEGASLMFARTRAHFVAHTHANSCTHKRTLSQKN